MYRKITYTTRVVDAPEIRDADLMSISEAAKYLDVSVQTVAYHMTPPEPKLTAVVKAGDEFTSYKRVRRWAIREEVKALKVEIVDHSLRGADWRTLEDGEIVLWIPEVKQPAAVKGATDNEPLRRITLNQEDTGDLDIDVVALRSGRKCSVRVDIQSEIRYPNMANIEVTLITPSGQRVETTDNTGIIKFDNVSCNDLPQARISIKVPTT